MSNKETFKPIYEQSAYEIDDDIIDTLLKDSNERVQYRRSSIEAFNEKFLESLADINSEYQNNDVENSLIDEMSSMVLSSFLKSITMDSIKKSTYTNGSNDTAAVKSSTQYTLSEIEALDVDNYMLSSEKDSILDELDDIVLDSIKESITSQSETQSGDDSITQTSNSNEINDFKLSFKPQSVEHKSSLKLSFNPKSYSLNIASNSQDQKPFKLSFTPQSIRQSVLINDPSSGTLQPSIPNVFPELANDNYQNHVIIPNVFPELANDNYQNHVIIPNVIPEQANDNYQNHVIPPIQQFYPQAMSQPSKKNPFFSIQDRNNYFQFRYLNNFKTPLSFGNLLNHNTPSNNTTPMMYPQQTTTQNLTLVSDYHDYSHTKDEDVQNNFKSMIGHPSDPFPAKLHSILENSERDGYASIISWLVHGRAFKIHNEKLFVERVIPRFFFQSKLSSFNRQLRMYGFYKIRITAVIDQGAFFNELFLRGRPGLARRMVRLKKPCSLHKETDPNLHLYPPMPISGMYAYGTMADGEGNDRPRLVEYAKVSEESLETRKRQLK